MEESDEKDTGVSLTRRIPLTVVLMLLAQMGGVLVWAAQLDTRVDGMERQCASGGNMSEKFARLEERLDNVRQDLEGVKQQLDHLTDRLLRP